MRPINNTLPSPTHTITLSSDSDAMDEAMDMEDTGTDEDEPADEA
jgi:hypothetical protein